MNLKIKKVEKRIKEVKSLLHNSNDITLSRSITPHKINGVNKLYCGENQNTKILKQMADYIIEKDRYNADGTLKKKGKRKDTYYDDNDYQRNVKDKPVEYNEEIVEVPLSDKKDEDYQNSNDSNIQVLNENIEKANHAMKKGIVNKRSSSIMVYQYRQDREFVSKNRGKYSGVKTNSKRLYRVGLKFKTSPVQTLGGIKYLLRMTDNDAVMVGCLDEFIALKKSLKNIELKDIDFQILIAMIKGVKIIEIAKEINMTRQTVSSRFKKILELIKFRIENNIV